MLLVVVISSTIQPILLADEGSAIGADMSQWQLKWADEIYKLWNGISEDNEYYCREAWLMCRLVGEKVKRIGKGRLAEDVPKEEMWAYPRHVLDSNDENHVSELPAMEIKAVYNASSDTTLAGSPMNAEAFFDTGVGV